MITHVILQTPKSLEEVVATVTSRNKPEPGDFVEALELGYVDKKVRGIVECVIEEETEAC